MAEPPDLPQIARDLKWVNQCPFLLKNSKQPVLGEWTEEIKESKTFRDFFENAPRSHRVGYYFESLIHFWLKEVRGVEIVEHGLQIQDGKRTVGELDFVFRDAQGELNHWEVAVKFYLHSVTPNHSGSHFVGPNARDTLERKHTRFIEHQLPLGKRTIPEITQQEMFVKGQIFYHPTDANPVVSTLLDDNHARGTWIRQSEIPSLERIEPPAHYRVLQKPFWLSGSESELMDFPELSSWLKAHYEKSDHPVLLSAVADSGAEIERIFVVNNRWPEE